MQCTFIVICTAVSSDFSECTFCINLIYFVYIVINE